MQGGTNAILVVLLALLVFACGSGLFVARAQSRLVLARGLEAMLVAIPVAYAAALVLTSFASRERVLGLHDPVAFCGLYLDCHISVTVDSVEKTRTIGSRKAHGVFYVLLVSYGSDAIRATLTPPNPRATVIDAFARAFPRSGDAEAALEAARGVPIPLLRPLRPGESYRTAFVFDVPDDATGLRLRLAPGTWGERVTELFLIGDDDSLLHQRTTIRLSSAES